MLKVCIYTAALSVVAPLTAQAQTNHPIKWDAELGVATENMGKGLGKNDDQIALLGSLTASSGGFYAALAAGSADLSNGAWAEATATIGYKGAFAGFTTNSAVIDRYQAGVNAGIDDNSIEFQQDIARQFGPVNARLRVNYTPDGLGATDAAWWTEIQGSMKLDRATTVSAAIADRSADNGADYVAWNVGAKRRLNDRFALDVRWYDTDSHELGSRYDGRLVAALTLSL